MKPVLNKVPLHCIIIIIIIIIIIMIYFILIINIKIIPDIVSDLISKSFHKVLTKAK